MEIDEQKTDEEKIQPQMDELAECRKKCDEYLAGWQRERADFQNYKKEESRRGAEMRTYLTESMVRELLTVLDSFDIAFDFVPDDLKGHKWIHGTEQIRAQLFEVLRREGVEVIKTDAEVFNLALHESVEEVASEKPEGTIVEEIQKGYMLDGKVIRPARVKVAKKISIL